MLVLHVLFKNVNCKVSEGLPADVFMASQMEAERVYVFKHAFNAAVDVALLRLSLSPENMWNLLLLFIVLNEKVPAEGWLHIVNEGTLLIYDFFLLFLLFGPVFALDSPRV